MSVVRTNIPQRLDRLPWSRFHWVVVIGLGITWILDGLEVTVVGSVGSRLGDRDALGLGAGDVGFAATAYLLGAVIGALGFGYLTDRYGRKKLFIITLAWYMGATLLTAFSWNLWSFLAFRFMTGLGIGGEYAAINSTIDELIPAANRGWVDIAINGTFWIGAMLGAGASIVLLDRNIVPGPYGWRIAFGIGAVLAVAIVFVRRNIPESPRWLLMRGRGAEAERTLDAIEARIVKDRHGRALPSPGGGMLIVAHRRRFLADVASTMLRTYPVRSFVALALMAAQAFFYNGIFFTESLVLSTLFGVPSGKVGYYIFPFAVGNLLGALLLGRFFDVVGRKPMIAGTYALSGFLLFATGVLFMRGALGATTITIAWSVIFFFASAGASAAYLTVSETFPLEIRAMAIAIVFSIGTLIGGVAAPAFFGMLIATKQPSSIFVGYACASAAMIAAAFIELWLGVEGARRPLEDIAAPLGAA